MTTPTRNLSDFWRIDSSPSKVMEMASVLQGCQSLIGLMGADFKVHWCPADVSACQTEKHQIYLNYKHLRGLTAPFPGERVDKVIGDAAHEGGHALWTESFDPKARLAREAWLTLTSAQDPQHRRTRALWRRDRDALVRFYHDVWNVLEDAYIDQQVAKRWPVLGEYIKQALVTPADAKIDWDKVAADPKPPIVAVRNLWLHLAVYSGDMPARISKAMGDAMQFLLSKTLAAVKSRQADAREDLALECLVYLVEHFSSVDEDLPQKQAAPSAPPQPGQGQQQGQGQEQDDQGGEAGAPDGQGEGEGGDDQEDQQDGDAGEGGDGQDDGEPGGGESPDGEPDGSVDGTYEEGEAPTGGSEGGEDADQPGDAGGHPGGQAGYDPDKDDGSLPGADGEAGGDGEGDEGGEAGEAEPGDDPEGDDEPRSPREHKDSVGGHGKGEVKPATLDGERDHELADKIGVPDWLRKAVEEAIAYEMENISKQVAEMMSLDPRQVAASAVKAQYDPALAQQVKDRVQAQSVELRRVFDQQKRQESRWLRGQARGRLDSTALAKVGVGNFDVRKRRQVLDKPDIELGLLLDVSGSMDRYMTLVWETAGVFANALAVKDGVEFAAWCYTGGYSDVSLTRLCDRRMGGKLSLGNVAQGGGTPSGLAIAGCAVLLARTPRKDKLLIHFTDGDPNDRAAVAQAVAECRKRAIEVFCISIGQSAMSLDQQYGAGHWQNIQGVAELPRAVAALLAKLDL